jgi:hypothetical protein
VRNSLSSLSIVNSARFTEIRWERNPQQALNIPNNLVVSGWLQAGQDDRRVRGQPGINL